MSADPLVQGLDFNLLFGVVVRALQTQGQNLKQSGTNPSHVLETVPNLMLGVGEPYLLRLEQLDALWIGVLLAAYPTLERREKSSLH